MITFTFHNLDVEVNEVALNSFKVQKAIAQMSGNPQRAFDALDTVFDGKLDFIIDNLQDDEGNTYEFGAPTELVTELIERAVKEAAPKN